MKKKSGKSGLIILAVLALVFGLAAYLCITQLSVSPDAPESTSSDDVFTVLGVKVLPAPPPSEYNSYSDVVLPSFDADDNGYTFLNSEISSDVTDYYRSGFEGGKWDDLTALKIIVNNTDRLKAVEKAASHKYMVAPRVKTLIVESGYAKRLRGHCFLALIACEYHFRNGNFESGKKTFLTLSTLLKKSIAYNDGLFEASTVLGGSEGQVKLLRKMDRMGLLDKTQLKLLASSLMTREDYSAMLPYMFCGDFRRIEHVTAQIKGHNRAFIAMTIFKEEDLAGANQDGVMEFLSGQAEKMTDAVKNAKQYEKPENDVYASIEGQPGSGSISKLYVTFLDDLYERINYLINARTAY